MEKKPKQARRKTDWEADEPEAEGGAPAAQPSVKPAAAKKEAKPPTKAALLSFGDDEEEEAIPTFKPKKSAPVRAPPPPEKPKADRPLYQSQPGEYSAERLREVSEEWPQTTPFRGLPVKCLELTASRFSRSSGPPSARYLACRCLLLRRSPPGQRPSRSGGS